MKLTGPFRFLRHLNVAKAWRDLRDFMGLRSDHELLYGTIAGVTTLAIIGAFVHDSAFDIEYHPKITWVRSWSENPTKEELAERQARYEKAKAELDAVKAKQEKQRKAAQELDNKIDDLGL